MAAKLTAEWDEDTNGRTVLLIRKSRGKITLDELTEFLLRDFLLSPGLSVWF